MILMMMIMTMMMVTMMYVISWYSYCYRMIMMMVMMMMIVILPCVHFRKEIKISESSAQIWTNMNENCKTKKRIE